MAGIRDVALRAGVSTSTVSRVISRKIPVDRQTSEKVMRVVTELKYQPNLVASGLRSRSARSIGLLVPRIADPFFMQMIDDVDRCVIGHGFNLLLFNTHADPGFEERVMDNLLRRHVDGVIISSVSDESRVPSLLMGVGVPIVMLDRVRDDAKLMHVVLDNRRAGELAAEHLLALGHRSIACVTGPHGVHLCADRLAGFSDRLALAGCALHPDLTIEGDFTFDAGRTASDRLFRGPRRPTAVWAQNDLMAAGILKAALAGGVRVPSDLSVMGMDDVLIPDIVHPSLTTIAQPLREMSERAVMMILKAKENTAVERRMLLEPTLVVRESTGPAPASARGAS
jgi:DNA-binding LacI/PurR family transcriptional regulator